jgi:Fe-S-cluster containining protein
MEFTLDFPFIRDILKQEHARARDEIRDLGVLRTFTLEERARVYAEVRANSVAIRKLGGGERVTRNVKCPFLNEGRCTIYAARPQSCRNYHATNVAGFCRQSYEEPENLDIDAEFDDLGPRKPDRA